MDVLVVGAGVAGCHVARELAPTERVTLLDREGVAAGATGLSAGLVAPTLFYDDRPAVARHANRSFRRFDGTAGFEFVERPRLDFVATDEGSARQRADRLADLGFPTSYLSAGAVERRYPRFDLGAYEGAVLYGDAGWVDPHAYTAALRREAVERGASVEIGVEVTGVLTDGDHVVGVETAGGSREADAVVLAAGWRTPELLPPGVDLPVRPYRTQCVVLDDGGPLPAEFPLVRLSDRGLYLRPEGTGDLLVGGGHGLPADPARASGDADESFRLEVASFLPTILPGFERAGVVTDWAGLDAATPDARPVIDTPEGAPDRLVVATGFNGLGVMVSPVVGPTVRERLGGDPAPFPTEPFDAGRFDRAGTAFELTSTSDV